MSLMWEICYSFDREVSLVPPGVSVCNLKVCNELYCIGLEQKRVNHRLKRRIDKLKRPVLAQELVELLLWISAVSVNMHQHTELWEKSCFWKYIQYVSMLNNCTSLSQDHSFPFKHVAWLCTIFHLVNVHLILAAQVKKWLTKCTLVPVS